jgi:phytoene dehydrogenase-like protein
MAPSYDVVVVGAGLGGLTVAALLAARGVSVCVLERQSQVGGCIARVEFSGHEFEPGMGIYSSFGDDEIYQRIFMELPVDIPETSLLTAPYVVRLADGTDVKLAGDESFFGELSSVFRECADAGVQFYRNPTPDAFARTSTRFQSFIDTQLRGFLHSSIDQCGYAAAATMLQRIRGPLYEIRGGPARLAERLAESIKRSGGAVRLNTPVLRLAYDQSGQAAGVDLLSGETVVARKAIVSNLTIWDTYGKLVGLNRTPTEIKKLLNTLQGTGAYLVYATMEDSAISRLPSTRLLAETRPVTDDDNSFTEFTLAIHGGTATLKSVTDVNEWFTFHASEEDFEESDQAALEHFWTKLHAAVPELGSGVEIIETANPRTYYEQTRRKLGMIMGLPSGIQSGLSGLQSGLSSGRPTAQIPSPLTVIPNLFIAGDTVSHFPTLDTVVSAALSLADEIKKR